MTTCSLARVPLPQQERNAKMCSVACVESPRMRTRYNNRGEVDDRAVFAATPRETTRWCCGGTTAKWMWWAWICVEVLVLSATGRLATQVHCTRSSSLLD